ncbi:hypothetical protein M885DRAFT_520886 [Pelagophyceae sp. CCMP2097]|nr:hypothetical protein M885DRAFT_520886 [Pelagophyceae sp. CCMP2097]
MQVFLTLCVVAPWFPGAARGSVPTADEVVALFQSEDPGIDESHACATTARRMAAARVWEKLESSLAAAAKPAVMVFSNAAYHALLHNFLCGLVARDLAHVLDHVVVWCADGASLSALQSDWQIGGVADRAVPLADVWAEDVQGDAPFSSAAYAKFAALKAIMPWAAAVLGYDALVQDADVVWRGDVLAYLAKTLPNAGAAVMADSNRVDVQQRPCKISEAEAIARDEPAARGAQGRRPLQSADAVARRRRLETKAVRARGKRAAQKRLPFSAGACAAFRCTQSVNGGFIFTRAAPAARRGAAVRALRDWAARCSEIYAARENQPAFVAALERVLPRRGCAYARDSQNATIHAPTWRRSNTTADLVVLNLDLFVSGRRAAFARQADARSELLAFHCNFRFGWKSKCETLHKLGMLPTAASRGTVRQPRLGRRTGPAQRKAPRL